MVELVLPKNSRVVDGKVWPKPANAKRVTEFKIYRYDPDGESNPRTDTYFVDRDDCGPMILDALLWIKNKIDPLSCSAVMFARISRIATELGYMDEHIQLLESIAEKCKGLSIGDVDTSVVH